MTDTLLEFYQGVVKLGGADSLAAKDLAEQIRLRDEGKNRTAEDTYIAGGMGRTLEQRVTRSNLKG